jgi:hypothetical protein
MHIKTGDSYKGIRNCPVTQKTLRNIAIHKSINMKTYDFRSPNGCWWGSGEIRGKVCSRKSILI